MATAADVMRSAGTVLNDDDHIRWPLSELANWINDGMRAVALAKPNACSRSVVLPMVVGTLQSLPAATTPRYLQLLAITRNLKDATEPRVGRRVVTLTSRESLDRELPDWHNPTMVRQKSEVRQYVYDEASPLEFYVYPGNDGKGVVEAIVATAPTPVAVATAERENIAAYDAIELSLQDVYAGALLDYVLFRSYSKDDGPGAAQAQAHYQLFATAIGIKIQVESSNSPNARKGVTTS